MVLAMPLLPVLFTPLKYAVSHVLVKADSAQSVQKSRSTNG